VFDTLVRRAVRSAVVKARWVVGGLGAAGLVAWLLLEVAPGARRNARSHSDGASEVRNVVLVSLDTLRADRVGSRRGEVRLTPRLDAFARRAVRFTNCRSVCGHTLASHKAILSGRLPIAFLRAFSRARKAGARVLGRRAYYRAAFRAWPFPSVASRLREAGLAAAAFTDGVYMDARYGLGAGFEPYASHRLGLARQVALAEQWLESLGPHRFFLFVHTYDVHCPYDPPPSYLHLFEKECTGRLRFAGTCGKSYFNALALTAEEKEHIARHYDAGVRHADDELGAFLGWLESTGRLADTAVIVTSDHGESLGERDFVGHGELYDNQLHVPLVVYRPRQVPATVDVPVSGVDVGATILDLLLGHVPPGLDGLSLRPLLEGAVAPPDFEDRVRVAAVTVNEGRPERTHLRKLALIAPTGLKVIIDPDDGESEVFDLAHDPGETRDLAGSDRPDVRSLLKHATRGALEPLRGLGGGGENLRQEGLSPEAVESLRKLGYVED
jgi:arylsulfatase A-like enzyme